MAPKRPSAADAGGADKRGRVERPPGAPPGGADLSKTIEEARKRAQQAFARTGLPSAPPLSNAPAHAPPPAPAPTAPTRPPRADPGGEREKVPTELHPLLANRAAQIQERFKALAPKFAALPNARPGASATRTASPAPGSAPSASAAPSPTPAPNPYLSAEPADDAMGPKRRSMHRSLQFHRPGRYVMQAEQIRREEQMNALKERIQERARKAGLQDELVGDERALRRPPPPDVEWWDAPLLPSKSYTDVPDAAGGEPVPDTLPHLAGPNAPLDHLVQHPIPIPAPTGLLRVQPKGVMLTKQEMKKMRKQRRAAEQQDKRDRIKMGLLPPDPPKVKLSNLMRVLSSEAIADPTKVEARVRREVAARREQHERTNAERMLTDEQRQQRRMYKTKVEEDKGIWCQVYRIRYLVSPSHKFKVRKNAQQHHLGGIVITHPDLALVVVEGSAKALKAYKRLMLVRIDWTDPGRPREGTPDEEAPPPPQDDVDYASNSCELVFEGPVRERTFPGGVVRTEACPTDFKVKELLGPNLAGYWEVAKRSLTATQLD
ncbi:U4/U5/U6 small nuclear ribonucleoprotein prp3 [Malassezia brasiliensis]|uniref:U4/U5/U6 small nuclear ribonucleoprotein prp3 n=1 Tax=Malassezia brasiliensis TaxID=1821822 RepID=A0AAF0DQ57_9BASI|nr:U4/U5/U6 small nuclear ribonucleoprotein prp3 [Malassezia brasiliensis]